MSIVNDPNDAFGRHFWSLQYIHYCSKGEKQDKSWFVYSKELDKVFFFVSYLRQVNKQIT